MNFSFALFSFPSWFVINYIHISKQTLFNQFFNNLTTIVVVLALWVGFHFTVLNYLYSDNYNYILFLETSIPVRILVGIFFYITLFLIFKIIIYYEDYEEKSQRENLLLRKINEAELSLLKSQINPHFLFNSLNSISLLTVTEPENAREMIIKMSDFLRYSISQTETKFTTLEKELRNVERYLDIEKIRFGDKLVFTIEVEANCLDKKLPMMILQPLYENAVKHGVYQSVENVFIHTNCRFENNFLFVEISNNFEKDSINKSGNKLGLKNIQDRLKLVYQNDSLLKVQKDETKFTVILIIPQIFE